MSTPSKTAKPKIILVILTSLFLFQAQYRGSTVESNKDSPNPFNLAFNQCHVLHFIISKIDSKVIFSSLNKRDSKLILSSLLGCPKKIKTVNASSVPTKSLSLKIMPKQIKLSIESEEVKTRVLGLGVPLARTSCVTLKTLK